MSTTATAPTDNEPLPTEASQPQTSMERTFAAGVWQEGERYVAQALQIDVASQGETVESALTNLREALELHFEPPTSTVSPSPQVHAIRVKVLGTS